MCWCEGSVMCAGVRVVCDVCWCEGSVMCAGVRVV